MTKQSYHKIDSNSPYNIFIYYLTYEMLNNILIALTINYISVTRSFYILPEIWDNRQNSYLADYLDTFYLEQLTYETGDLQLLILQ